MFNGIKTAVIMAYNYGIIQHLSISAKHILEQPVTTRSNQWVKPKE